jgi:phosphoribosylformylglycinamidine synthase
MEPFEVMTSESQERMLAIVEPDDLEEVLAICARWEVAADVVGKVTATGQLRILDGWEGEVLADVPASSLHDAAPLYERPMSTPPRADDAAADVDAVPDDCGADLLGLLTDTSWVYRQYDHQLFLNTVVGPGDDATVLRLKHPTTGQDTGRGLALTTDGNHRWCAVDAKAGTAMVVAEAVLNLACVGARPLALVNCLNFGDPEHPEVMGQLSDAVDGMSEACLAFGLPVVGGNVSLYNASEGTDIDPTPVVGVLGLVDDLSTVPPGAGLVAGDRLVLVGPEHDGLGGSEWARTAGLARQGELPPLDLKQHSDVAAVVRGVVTDGLVDGVHDVASGGLGLALAEMAVASGIGFAAHGVADHRGLFSEAPSRVVLCVAPEREAEVLARAQAAGVPHRVLGEAGGDRLVVDGLVDLTLDEATTTWRNRLPDALDAVAR